MSLSSFSLLFTEKIQAHSRFFLLLSLPRVANTPLSFRLRQRYSALNTFKYSSFGFTLIELLAAVVVFSIVSVLAVQALNISIYQRNVLERVDDEIKSLGRALTLLRQDLQAALPMPFYPAHGTPKDAFVISNDKQQFDLSISGHPRFPGEPGVGFARVSWNLDSATGILYRNVISSLNPLSSALTYHQQPILGGVEDFVIDTVTDDVPLEQENAQLPRTFFVTLVTTKHGIVSVRVTR